MAKKQRPTTHHHDEDEQVRQAPKPDYKGTPFGEGEDRKEPDSADLTDAAEGEKIPAEATQAAPQHKGTARTIDPALPLHKKEDDEEGDFVLMEFPFDLNVQRDGGKGIVRFKKGTQKVPADLAGHIYLEKAGVKRV